MLLRIAVLHVLSGRALSLVIMAAGFAALARLLPPAAFGQFAVAMAVHGIADVLVLFGLRQRIIGRAADHSPSEIASAAGLSLTIAACLGTAGLALAILGRSWLPEPYADLLIPLSLSLFIKPFTLGPEALMQRALRFGPIASGDVIRVSVDALVAVGLAAAGFGATALAWGFLVSNLAMAAFLIAVAKPDQRVRPGLGAWRPLLPWGERMTAIQLLSKFSEIAVLAVLSVLQGAAVVGLFNRAQTIHNLVDRALFDGIKPLVLPALSGALRDGTPPARLYRIKLDHLTGICWPGFTLIALLADPLVALLLGRDWDGAVGAVRILALIGISIPLTKMSQKLFVALDEIAVFLRIEATREAVRVPLAVAGALISLEAFALAYVAGNIIKAVGIARYLHGRIGGPEGGYRPVLRSGALLTLAALAGPLAVLSLALPPAATLGLALPLAALGWLGAAATLRHPTFGMIVGILSAARAGLQKS